MTNDLKKVSTFVFRSLGRVYIQSGFRNMHILPIKNGFRFMFCPQIILGFSFLQVMSSSSSSSLSLARHCVTRITLDN